MEIHKLSSMVAFHPPRPQKQRLLRPFRRQIQHSHQQLLRQDNQNMELLNQSDPTDIET